MAVLLKFAITFLTLLSVCQTTVSWRYETRCTRIITDPNLSVKSDQARSSSTILDDLESAPTSDDIDADDSSDYSAQQQQSQTQTQQQQQQQLNQLTLRCANTNDFLFIGLTQYGVMTSSSSNSTTTNVQECTPAVLAARNTAALGVGQQQHDCLVTVDYIANQCNGFNLCHVQLDAQFLHSCKRHSDYLSLAYECIPGAQRVDICSNDETFLIDSTLNTRSSMPHVVPTSSSGSSSPASSLSRFGAFYLTSPAYPSEYANNLANCSCRLEYVRIESSPSIMPGQQTSSSSSSKSEAGDKHEINVALNVYEFDLEEQETGGSGSGGVEEPSSSKCNKDYFRIDSTGATSASDVFVRRNETLCGHYKEFREFYARGRSIDLNFQTDDFISRRGFLFKISTIAPTQCPAQAHRRFDSTRCVSVHHERVASWPDASRTCASRGGRLLALNDFVDSMRMNALLRADESASASSSSVQAAQYWIASSSSPSSNSNRKSGTRKKCSSKSIVGWHEEKSCSTKRAFICEYDAVRRAPELVSSSGMSDTNGNRLIRVSCGQPMTTSTGNSFLTSQPDSTKPTRASDSSSSSSSSTKSIPSNSILNTQRPEPIRQASSHPAVIINSIVAANDKDYEDDYSDPSSMDSRDSELKPAVDKSSGKLSSSSSSAGGDTQQAPAAKNQFTGSSFRLFTQDYLLIIAIVCGMAIVLVAVNVFCIWNYYNKKLNGHFKRDFVMIASGDEPHHHHQAFHQSSTLLSRSASTRPSQKNKKNQQQNNNNNNNTSKNTTSSLSSSNTTNSTSSSAGSSSGVGGLHSALTNRTLTSCLGGLSAGSYIRVPVYDMSAHHQAFQARESTDSGISGASFGNNNTNTAHTTQIPVECLRMLLSGSDQTAKPVDVDPQTLSHYYETLSKKHQQISLPACMMSLGGGGAGEYHVYNPVESSEISVGNPHVGKFDSMVVMPALMQGNHHQQQTVVLLTSSNMGGPQPVGLSTLTTLPVATAAAALKATSQYSSMIYGDLGTSSPYGGSSSASTASAGSNKPLLASFGITANTSVNNNNNNNQSSVSTDIEAVGAGSEQEALTNSSDSSMSNSPIQDDPNV